MEISSWETTKADLLYYKGDILTLWMYLSELFARHDQHQLLAPSTLSSTPNLCHLLLRHLECSFLIRKMTSPKVKTGINLEDLLTKLDRILDVRDLHPDHKTRALALRVFEQANWLPDRVEDVNGGGASDVLKQTSIRQSREAISIHEEFATGNGVVLHFVNETVKRSLGFANAKETWEVVCNQLPLLDRDDLYFSVKSLTQRVFKAVMSRDANALRMCLPALNQTLSLGEWGRMFNDKWWRAEEMRLAKTELWRKACDGETLHSPNIQTPVTRNPVHQATVHSQSNQSHIMNHERSQQHSSYGSDLTRQLTTAIAKAVVTDVVNDTNQAFMGAPNSYGY